ncbi:hypothetical protein [Roseisalinus antarcticus]|uniref:Uncharacterized protein n=1 Tax=Roseisalinus antarcticus TaxID=254357 RepID=A0A1Y5S1Z7_9RHOB|nr:hypothetical protein [Roseisalinus antarcticus]SLN30491.1 hypothetical protein ROA7023_01039 [Roseisalinus antarcticus]
MTERLDARNAGMTPPASMESLCPLTRTDVIHRADADLRHIRAGGRHRHPHCTGHRAPGVRRMPTPRPVTLTCNTDLKDDHIMMGIFSDTFRTATRTEATPQTRTPGGRAPVSTSKATGAEIGRLRRAMIRAGLL